MPDPIAPIDDTDFVTPTLAPLARRHAPYLPPELAHASGLPALNALPFVGGNILIENADREPVGAAFERFRSLLKSFLINTNTPYQPDVTEQTGKEVWQKLWKGGWKRLQEAALVVLYLEPRQELRFKTARQAFIRERIDYANVLGALLDHRLFYERPTWVFTPRRVDDPEFIEAYGEAFARLVNTNFSTVHFGQPGPGRPEPRNLAPADVRWWNQPLPAIFLDATTGATWNPDTGEREYAVAAQTEIIDETSRTMSVMTRPQSASQADTEGSPYAARLIAYYRNNRRILISPETAPAAPEAVTRVSPAPPRTRIFYGEALLPAPRKRWGFHLDHNQTTTSSA